MKTVALKIAHPKKRAFLAAYSRCINISEAAKRAKIDRRTHYDWMENDPEYPVAFERAKEEAGDALEDKMQELFFDGNVTAGIFLLKGLRPSKYRENVAMSHSGGLTVKRLIGVPEEEI